MQIPLLINHSNHWPPTSNETLDTKQLCQPVF
jgi:hypothetical protein